MAITPSGQPAWTRTSGFETYGGNVNKRNHLSQGVVDPETDVGAEEFSRIVADLEAITRVSPFCVIRYECNDSSPAAPTVISVSQMTGVNTAGYEGDAAPSGMPSLARNGDGDVTITWDSTYADPYSISGAIDIRFCNAGLSGTVYGQAVYELVTSSSVRVRAFDGAAAAEADAIVTVEVW